MKRTRRVELIRYSRRFTTFSDDGAREADATAEQAAIDVLLQRARRSRPLHEEAEDAGRHTGSSDVAWTPSRRPFFKLLDWLKRG